MRRTPSASKLVKGLQRLAHEAEAKAAKLGKLGLDDYAHSVSAAAEALSAAARAVDDKRSAV